MNTKLLKELQALLLESYENAASTKMLATHCCICGKPLRDAVSVDLGIGPICRQTVATWMQEAHLEPGARERVNVLIHSASVKVSQGKIDEALQVATEITRLNFPNVAMAIVKACKGVDPVYIHDEGPDHYRIKTPYNPDFVTKIKAARIGAQFHKDANRTWYCHNKTKRVVWNIIKDVFKGGMLVSGKATTKIPS